MANHKSALKRHRQSLAANVRNRAVKTRIKNAIKDVRHAIQNEDKEAALQALRKASSVMDKAGSKKILHWRTAARKISRLNKAVNALA